MPTTNVGAGIGELKLKGSTSGVVTVKPAAAAGTHTLTLPTSGGSSGQLLSTNGAGVTSWVNAMPYMVDVTKPPYNAVGDDSTDNTAAIQAALDANPLGDIFIPRSNASGIYCCTGSIILTNTSGKNFQGNIFSDGATIKFTTAGSAAATDANMQKGFVAYPGTNGAGGDTSGWSRDGNKAVMRGLKIDGPSNGVSVYLTNSIDFTIEGNYFSNARYGLAMESTIGAKIYRNTFYNHRNAGIGFIYSNNPSVYYSTGFWNDSPTVIDNAFAWGNYAGALAFILDHGSLSGRNRVFIGNHMQGANDKSGTQYGYLGRAVLPFFQGNWVENVKYAFRIVSTNANEGGTNDIPGISGAQPSGTYKFNAMPDAYSFGATFFNNYTHSATIAFQPDCNGIVIIGGNLTDGTVTTDLKLTQGGKTCIDLGNRSSTASWIVSNSYGGYVDAAKLEAFTAPTTGTTVGAAGGASALPATPVGYMTVDINGTNRKIPYYNV